MIVDHIYQWAVYYYNPLNNQLMLKKFNDFNGANRFVTSEENIIPIALVNPHLITDFNINITHPQLVVEESDNRA